jgi:predicted transposase/invertase (TIGR01784 family)
MPTIVDEIEVATKASDQKQPEEKLHQPHDKLLFMALSDHEVAKDALRAYLPETLLARADLNKIERYNTKFVTPEFKALEADIIFKVPLLEDKGAGLFLFHCEQQTKAEINTPLRVWQYLLAILVEYRKAHPKDPLPVVYPMILYTGEKPYGFSTQFFDLFGDNKALAESLFLQEIKLVDLCRMSDEEIQKHALFGLTEYAFKHKRTQNIKKFLATLFPWMKAAEVEFQIDSQYGKILLRYILSLCPHGGYELFMESAKQYLSKSQEDKAMTLAEELIQKGRYEGMQQGMQEGMQKGVQKIQQIALQMLNKGMSVNEVTELTGLSSDKVSNLQEKETSH